MNRERHRGMEPSRRMARSIPYRLRLSCIRTKILPDGRMKFMLSGVAGKAKANKTGFKRNRNCKTKGLTLPVCKGRVCTQRWTRRDRILKEDPAKGKFSIYRGSILVMRKGISLPPFRAEDQGYIPLNCYNYSIDLVRFSYRSGLF